MPRVNVHIEAMALKRIDAYCKEKNIPRSKLFVRGALSMVNSQPIPRCQFCKSPSMGKYNVSVHTWDQGEMNQEYQLCTFHLKKAQSEGEVSEV